jgi:integrase
MLTDAKARNSKPALKAFKLVDGQGLHLLVHPNGGKYWQLRYRFTKRERTASLGTYPEVSLSEARTQRDEIRKSIKQGIDPVAQKRAERLSLAEAQEKTFEKVANQWFAVWEKDKSENTIAYKRRRMEAEIFPSLGRLPVAQITRRDVLATLHKVASGGRSELPHRVLQTIKSVLSYAVLNEYRDFNPVSDLKPDSLLGTTPVKNHARIEVAELPELLLAIEGYQGLATRFALKLLALTFVRTGELRGAKWSEISESEKRWTIPAERTKKVRGVQRPHIVPLSKQALEVVQSLGVAFGRQGYLFKGNSGQLISENTILFALGRLGYKGRMTGHGFRGLASTVLHESDFSHLVIERQLGHLDRDEVSSAYNHAEFLTQRAEMMQWWGDFLENSLKKAEQKSPKVVA